ncbi:MAG: ATP-binding cassette domain-containing protein [Candidatus Latescibacteria bacterium]|nr:ATP-binding cassette domain-containing protein [Candidatus Latescibacterota bacterium]
MSPSQAFIQIKGLTHTYSGSRRSPARRALQGIELDVGEGEMIALLGPNGSGKSTLARILMTALKPQAGQVLIGGYKLPGEAARVRRQLGVVFQSPALDGKMTVGENLTAAARLYGLGRARPQIDALLREMDLYDRIDERVEGLSGGLARRVELAKALLPDPPLLILDEPTTGLDPVARQEFWARLEQLRRRQPRTVVVTSHLMDEAQRCDRVAILHQGHLLACDRPEQLQRAVGQRVLVLEGEDLDDLQLQLAQVFALQGTIVDGALRLRLDRSVSLDAIADHFQDRIRSLALAHPSLDDVFVHFTGNPQQVEEDLST